MPTLPLLGPNSENLCTRAHLRFGPLLPSSPPKTQHSRCGGREPLSRREFIFLQHRVVKRLRLSPGAAPFVPPLRLSPSIYMPPRAGVRIGLSELVQRGPPAAMLL